MSLKVCFIADIVRFCAVTGLTICVAAPAWADDCGPVKAAMLATVKKPHTIILNRIKDGQPVTNRMIQTKDAKYVEYKGKWHTLPVTADDVREMEKSFKETTFTCTRVGRESVGGQTVTVYASHYKNDDAEGDAKLWIGADGLPVKSESTHDGQLTSSTFDFAHGEAPADATPLVPR